MCRIALLLVGAPLVLARSAPSTAELYVPDAVSAAIADAGQALQRGEPRSKVLARYRAATEAVRDSASFLRNGVALLEDLEASIEREAATGSKATSPEATLMDSQWWPRVWRPELRERETVREMFRGGPEDPAKALLLGDRNVIGRLLPLLDDRTPTRAYTDYNLRHYPVIPRVCDLALSIIQFHGRVWFFDQFAFSGLLHERREAIRAQVATIARTWWSSAQSLSVADGIRRLLPGAGFYEKASMAENLIALGQESADPSMQAEGRGVLLKMFRDSENSAGHAGAYLARTLERYGDTSPVEAIYRRLAAARGLRGHIVDSGLVSYLIAHADRREWELLTELASEDPRTLRSVVNSEAGMANLWAVPAVALALDRTEESGSRSIAGAAAQSYSIADKATEQLQAVTGVAFDYRPSGTSEDRRAAITRAQRWWKDEGQARYTFAAIEKILRDRANGEGR